MAVRIEVAGQDAFIVYFSDKASPHVSAQIQAAVAEINTQMLDIIIDMVPSYASLLVIFDLDKTDLFTVRHGLKDVLDNLDTGSSNDGELIKLPVYYSEESGPDLPIIAERGNISINKVIEIHQQTEYRVYAIGFAPGFAFLGQVDERIAAPRLSTPRQKVPRGAVAIADRQTAIYPSQSPGGWNLIGLCPTRMFNPDKQPTMQVQVGDRIRFEAIDRHKFLELGGTL